MKVLNLYAGIGGNRKLWPDDWEVTAVEYQQDIADLYQKLYPNDTVICGDAHEYLISHFQEYDFIWSSPPCPTHSKMILSGRNRTPRYPDMSLYQQVLLLKHQFKGGWVVENVVPYYEPLIPAAKVGRHMIWCDFYIPEIDIKQPKNFINLNAGDQIKQLQDWLGIHFEERIYCGDNHCPAQTLRNAVHPALGKHIAESWLREATQAEMF